MSFKTHSEEVAEFNAVRLYTGLTAGNMDAIAYQLEGNEVKRPVSNTAIAAFLRSAAKKLYAINHGEPMEIVTQKPLACVQSAVESERTRCSNIVASYGTNDTGIQRLQQEMLDRIAFPKELAPTTRPLPIGE